MSGRIARTIALVALVVLQGCSSLAWVYERADWLVVRSVDGLVDLTADQKEWLYGRVRGHLSWHRKKALPTYARVLTGAKERLADGLDARELAFIEEAVRLQARTLAKRVLPDAAELLARLGPAQIRHLDEELADGRDDAREELERPLEERKTESAERMADLVEDWVGPLSDEQRADIERMSRALPTEASRIQQERERRQAELLELLTTGRTKRLPDRLRSWLIDSPTEPSEAWQQAVRAMTLTIDRSLTEEQRDYLLRRIDELIREIAQIAYAGSASGR